MIPSRAAARRRAIASLRATTLAAMTLLSTVPYTGAWAQSPTNGVARPAPNTTLQAGTDAAAYVAPLASYEKSSTSELRDVVDRYTADRAALYRRNAVEYAPERHQRMSEFNGAWAARLRETNFDSLSQEGRIDYILLRTRLKYETGLLEREQKIWSETTPFVPFASTIFDLMERRRRMEAVDPAAAARTLAQLTTDIERATKAVEAGLRKGDKDTATVAEKVTPLKPTRIVAFRTTDVVRDLQTTLGGWYRFFAGYDPVFTWWNADPYKKAHAALDAYAKVLREKVVGVKPGDDDPIVGDPIGRAGIMTDLEREMLPYTPEELIAIAEREFAWCEKEMLRASREMGFGDDWKKALEKVKTLHLDPGKQPELVRMLAFEAMDFIEQRNLVTIPPLARDIWRIEMMTPERQKVAPFFLGGEVILVAFPTDAMPHDDKMMSMRGNNVHFARATVHHELIPGHHLQGFMTSRYNNHRGAFSTPFWGEGWALYWEMLLWDKGFQTPPEDRVGALFWRMHRAARIMFSLGFHLGTMTPQQSIDFLVDRVGHERANATAEVRRSFNGTYSPLYQVAYMMGGLQFRALHQELVGSGKMADRDFHDTILKGGTMPVEMVRARLVNAPLTHDYTARWKFAGDVPVRR